MDKNRIRVILIIGYGLMTLVHLFATMLGWQDLAVSSKILLMPWLIVFAYFSQGVRISILKPLLIGALILSWIGDILLIGDDKQLFIGGLISFLIAHLFYIIIFRKLSTGVAPVKTWKQIAMIALPIYLMFMLYYLYPLVDKTLFPAVAIYAFIISIMAFSAIAVLSKPIQQFHKYIFMGVILFLISDSILAINKFGHFEMSANFIGFYIMSTYCAAQAMLALGITTAWKHVG